MIKFADYQNKYRFYKLDPTARTDIHLRRKKVACRYGMRKTIGFFQLKEHIAVIGLALRPVYWHFWRSVPLGTGVATRRFLTILLMLSVWWSLVVGYVLTNVKGLA